MSRCLTCGAEMVFDPLFGFSYCPLRWFPREHYDRLSPGRVEMAMAHYEDWLDLPEVFK